jgi:hypothetical protein
MRMRMRSGSCEEVIRRREEEDRGLAAAAGAWGMEDGRGTGVCIGNAREKRKMRSSGADKTLRKIIYNQQELRLLRL